jgi:hypothetical protein
MRLRVAWLLACSMLVLPIGLGAGVWVLITADEPPASVTVEIDPALAVGEVRTDAMLVIAYDLKGDIGGSPGRISGTVALRPEDVH